MSNSDISGGGVPDYLPDRRPSFIVQHLTHEGNRDAAEKFEHAVNLLEQVKEWAIVNRHRAVLRALVRVVDPMDEMERAIYAVGLEP